MSSVQPSTRLKQSTGSSGLSNRRQPSPWCCLTRASADALTRRTEDGSGYQVNLGLSAQELSFSSAHVFSMQ